GGADQVVPGRPQHRRRVTRAAVTVVVGHGEVVVQAGRGHAHVVEERVIARVAVVVDADVDRGGTVALRGDVQDGPRDDEVYTLGVLEVDHAADRAARRGGEGDLQGPGLSSPVHTLQLVTTPARGPAEDSDQVVRGRERRTGTGTR